MASGQLFQETHPQILMHQQPRAGNGPPGQRRGDAEGRRGAERHVPGEVGAGETGGKQRRSPPAALASAALSVPLPGQGTPTSTPPPMTLWPPAARPAWPSAWLPCRNLPSLQPTWPGCAVTRPGHHARGANVLFTRLPRAPQADPRPTQR